MGTEMMMRRFGFEDGGAGATPARVGDFMARIEARLRAAHACADGVEMADALEELAGLRRALVARGVMDLVKG